MTVPAHEAGLVAVTVTNLDGLSGSMVAAYAYQPAGTAAATLSLVPGAGQSLLAVWGGGSVDELIALAAASGCERDSVAANAAAGAGLVLYVPGAPDPANSSFLDAYPGGSLLQSAVFLRCA